MACIAQFSCGLGTLGPIFDYQTKILKQTTAFGPPRRLVYTVCFAQLVTANTFCSHECVPPFLNRSRHLCVVLQLCLACLDEVHDMNTLQIKLTAFNYQVRQIGQLACLEEVGDSHLHCIFSVKPALILLTGPAGTLHI